MWPAPLGHFLRTSYVALFAGAIQHSSGPILVASL